MPPLLATTQLLMTVDTTVMNVSISALVDDLDTTISAVQLVITSYTLVMAATMITAARSATCSGAATSSASAWSSTAADHC